MHHDEYVRLAMNHLNFKVFFKNKSLWIRYSHATTLVHSNPIFFPRSRGGFFKSLTLIDFQLFIPYLVPEFLPWWDFLACLPQR